MFFGKSKYSFLLTLIAAALATNIFFNACRPTEKLKKFRIGFSQCCDDPWRDMMEQEMNRELSFHPEMEFKLLVAENNSERQIEQIRELVASGIDLLIVSPNEARPLTPVIEEVYKSGTPVILIDRKTDSEAYTAYIGADNFNIGETAARYIASTFGGKGKIIELQLGMTMTPAVERSRGFRKGISGYPGLSTVAQLELRSSIEVIKKQFKDTLVMHPEVNIVFCHNDFLAENAFNWALETGVSRDLFFVGIDGIPGMGKGIQAVEDGTLDASLLYPTGGAEAIRLATAILNSLPFDKKNTLETIVIDDGNAHILHLQMKKVESLQHTIDGQLKIVTDLNAIYQSQRIYILVLLSSLLLAIVLGGILLKLFKAKVSMNRALETKNREVLEHEHQILEMSEQLKTATQAKVDFFTNISHEFRTPLTLILGYIEGLINTRNPTNVESKADLSMVRKNALRLLRLVNQLMDFRKIESGKMLVRASENDLIGFTREIVQAFQKMATKHNIDLRFQVHETELRVWFDVNMLDKVLFNLLSNAFKFTPDSGSIKVTIVKDDIHQQTVIKVEDTGRGMSLEEREQAFEPFYQGAEHKSKGTGLGLALSKELIQLHGGQITLWSEPSIGTRFEVFLPMGNAHFREDQLVKLSTGIKGYDEFIFEEDTLAGGKSSIAVDNKFENTLLIVEDNTDMRQFLKKHFGKNYNILEAGEGGSGLQLAFEEMPDIIILDVNMPGKDGLTIARTLKSDLRTSHIPVVLLTARSSMDQKIEGIQTGADAYVTKPFNLVLLTEILKNLLQGRVSLRERYQSSLQPEKLATGMGDMDQRFVRRFLEFIEANYAEQELTVENLSEEFGLSRVHLYRKVKALLGESVTDFIQHIRLKKAAVLLMESELNVSEIAYKVGYSSPGYFSTAFKKRFSCSPTEYKDRQAGELQR